MKPVPGAIAPALLPWFDAAGRHDLPWQRAATPYRIWVSEVMLQQTQVETVRGYFARFVAELPDVAALAAAPADAVMRLWSGLGYYARARNLHRAAKQVVANHGGQLPTTLAALVALPGIGRSTAGAILALAHGARHPILDGNVKRVLARVFAVEASPDSAAGLAALWALAEAATPATRVSAYTQAIMDLGSTVCMRANPACPRCPLAAICAARASGRTSQLPVARRRAPRRLERAQLLLVTAGRRVLLERRPPRGIWGGLHAPPQFADAQAAQAWLEARFPAAPPPQRLPTLRHAFTHFDLDLEPWLLRLPARAGRSRAGEGRWHELAALEAVGLPAPVARLLEELRDGPNRPLREARPRGGRPRSPAVSG